MADHPGCLALKSGDLCTKGRAQFGQRCLIHGNASDLHARQHFNEWQLNFAIEAQRAGLAQLFREGAARGSRHECGEDRLLQRL